MAINELIIFFKTVLPILLAIFIAVLISILLVRIIVSILLLFAYKKYHRIVQKIQSRRIAQVKETPQEDDELFIKKGNLSPLKPKKNVAEKITSKREEQEGKELKEVRIVDIIKPVGFWTSMILGQKLTYLVSSAKLMNDNSHKGFWVSMVEAQERAQGRQKGRSL